MKCNKYVLSLYLFELCSETFYLFLKRFFPLCGLYLFLSI